MKKITKLLGFESQYPRDNTLLGPNDPTVLAEPIQMPFKPMGLIIWGATAQTVVDKIQCANQYEAVAGSAPIPASYFEVGHTFEEIVRLADSGELELSLPQRQVLNIWTMYPGAYMTIGLRGPFQNLCVWGFSVDEYRSGPMPRKVVIDQLGSRFVGTVTQFSLDGDEELLTVEAPTAECCANVIGSTVKRGL